MEKDTRFAQMSTWIERNSLLVGLLSSVATAIIGLLVGVSINVVNRVREELMRISVTAVIAMLLVCPNTALAARLKPGFFVCGTEDAFDEINAHVAQNDRRGADYLVKSGACFVSPEDGMEISILDRGFAKTKIRLYRGDLSAIAWTYAEAIE